MFCSMSTGSLYIERTSRAGSGFSIFSGQSRSFIPGSLRAENMRRRLLNAFDTVQECERDNFIYYEFSAVLNDADAQNITLLSKLF